MGEYLNLQNLQIFSLYRSLSFYVTVTIKALRNQVQFTINTTCVRETVPEACVFYN
jgi:hypothetical protein